MANTQLNCANSDDDIHSVAKERPNIRLLTRSASQKLMFQYFFFYLIELPVILTSDY